MKKDKRKGSFFAELQFLPFSVAFVKKKSITFFKKGVLYFKT